MRLMRERTAVRKAAEAQCRKEITMFSLQTKAQQFYDCMAVARYRLLVDGSWVRTE